MGDGDGPSCRRGEDVKLNERLPRLGAVVECPCFAAPWSMYGLSTGIDIPISRALS